MDPKPWFCPEDADNTNAGTATVTVKGIRGYEGEASASFKIAIPLDNAQVTGLSDQTYTGKEFMPAPTVTLDGATLKVGADYTVA